MSTVKFEEWLYFEFAVFSGSASTKKSGKFKIKLWRNCFESGFYRASIFNCKSQLFICLKSNLFLLVMITTTPDHLTDYSFSSLKKELTFQRFFMSSLFLGFNGIKNGCSDKQIGKSADDKAEGTDVLFLHTPALLLFSRCRLYQPSYFRRPHLRPGMQADGGK